MGDGFPAWWRPAALVVGVLLLVGCAGGAVVPGSVGDELAGDEVAAPPAPPEAARTSPALPSPSSDPQATPSTPRDAATPLDGPDDQAVASVVARQRESGDACGGHAAELPESHPDHLPLRLDGLVVVAIVCDSFAYQSTFDLWAWNGGDLVSIEVEQWGNDSLTSSPMILGYPYVDDDGLVANLEKARGIGDCGLLQRWFLEDAERLRLFEARERACSADDYIPPEEWPTVYVAGE